MTESLDSLLMTSLHLSRCVLFHFSFSLAQEANDSVELQSPVDINALIITQTLCQHFSAKGHVNQHERDTLVTVSLCAC